MGLQQTLKALADPTRREILNLLKNGKKSAGEISDHFDITAAAISADFGLSIQKSQAISFWNAVIDSSKQTVGLFPTEKIGFESVISICPANRLNVLITDWNALEEDLVRFDEQGIEVVVVEKEDYSFVVVVIAFVD